MTSEKIPEDLGLKIGSKAEKAWTDIAKQCETTIEASMREVEINKVILDFAKKRVVMEHEKFK